MLCLLEERKTQSIGWRKIQRIHVHCTICIEKYAHQIYSHMAHVIQLKLCRYS